MAETNPSPSNLGKKPPKWYFTDEELMHLPSRRAGMDAASELKHRREAAEFIQVLSLINYWNNKLKEMAERLNQNLPQHRGQMYALLSI